MSIRVTDLDSENANVVVSAELRGRRLWWSMPVDKSMLRDLLDPLQLALDVARRRSSSDLVVDLVEVGMPTIAFFSNVHDSSFAVSVARALASVLKAVDEGSLHEGLSEWCRYDMCIDVLLERYGSIAIYAVDRARDSMRVVYAPLCLDPNKPFQTWVVLAALRMLVTGEALKRDATQLEMDLRELCTSSASIVCSFGSNGIPIGSGVLEIIDRFNLGKWVMLGNTTLVAVPGSPLYMSLYEFM